MHAAISLDSLSGAALRPHLDALAALRIAVFRDWPCLYDGDVAYEREYLEAYARSPRSVVVLARDGEAVVGASTGLPLAEDGAEFLPGGERGAGAGRQRPRLAGPGDARPATRAAGTCRRSRGGRGTTGGHDRWPRPRTARAA